MDPEVPLDGRPVIHLRRPRGPALLFALRTPGPSMIRTRSPSGRMRSSDVEGVVAAPARASGARRRRRRRHLHGRRPDRSTTGAIHTWQAALHARRLQPRRRPTACRRSSREHAVAPAAVRDVVHGSTVATNAILERTRRANRPAHDRRASATCWSSAGCGCRGSTT